MEVIHIPQDDFDKSPEDMDETERIAAALDLAHDFSHNDGEDHKQWIIDQMVRVLTGSPIVKSAIYAGSENGKRYTVDTLGESKAYKAFVKDYNDNEDDGSYLVWDTGAAP